jgi:hypothetical protein
MSRGQLPEMKVLFMSGYAEKIVLNHRIMDVGTNFLQKPFTLGSPGRKDSRGSDGWASAECGIRLGPVRLPACFLAPYNRPLRTLA